MSNLQCPNCKQFKYKKQSSISDIGLFVVIFSILSLFIVPGYAKVHGGSSGDISVIVMIIFVIGCILIVVPIFTPNKKDSFRCENCNFEG
jgi:hypothetical protein